MDLCPMGRICLATIFCCIWHADFKKGAEVGTPPWKTFAFYIKQLPDVVDRQLPCFLVDICGSLLSVYGIVNTSDEDVLCEPLVTSFPLVFFDNERRWRACARL